MVNSGLYPEATACTWCLTIPGKICSTCLEYWRQKQVRADKLMMLELEQENLKLKLELAKSKS